ncbi:hypothetical protein [Sphingorhabdus sp. Alg239-R122]|uniref:hypothetical protein n=1 Tax=Sphingorhabdus sp. Alg239-R122 TaxID=2305989 RepID=UPI0013DCE535|nr:hypothetical protein [Sphingorhabdus sp. Alg239-R122]
MSIQFTMPSLPRFRLIRNGVVLGAILTTGICVGTIMGATENGKRGVHYAVSMAGMAHCHSDRTIALLHPSRNSTLPGHSH